jgi:hypothetical protein
MDLTKELADLTKADREIAVGVGRITTLCR